MRKKIFILILEIYSVYVLSISHRNICQKIECGKTSGIDICIEVGLNSSILQECPEGQICNISSEDPIENAKCIEKNNTIKRLPTLPCNNNEDCLSNICKEGVCVGIKEGEKCNSETQCEYGKTCRREKSIKEEIIFKCLPPIEIGGTCSKDTDCTINSGCLNNICTKYFSLKNGQQSRENEQEYDLTFCQSGYSNELGICLNFSLNNEITECSEDSPCTYNSDGNTFVLPSNCLCGYNLQGKQYCLLGPGNKNYTKYLKKLQEYHLNNENCHLSERTSEGCQKDILENKPKTLLKIHELINSRYWAKSNNKLINAPDCVYKVEAPDYDRSIEKDVKPKIDRKCAIYSCKTYIKNGAYCASSTYETEFSIKVDLSDICQDDNSCKIGGEPNEVFYNETNINAKCSSNSMTNKRYPGEKCEIDTECMFPLNNPSSQFHKCEEGRCNGIDEGGICEDNSWCLAGYFCDKFSGKCKEQQTIGSTCYESKDCQNNLLCINSKCSDELFSFPDGKEVPIRESIEFQKKYCKNGEIINGTCVSFNDEEKKLSDNDYKQCGFDSTCKYKILGLKKESKLEISCPCGYNDQGKGYCPHFHEYFSNDWNDYRKELKISYDNECHTENRYNCYNEEKLNNIKIYKNRLEKGHLFYQSVECARKVLAKDFISINRILVLLGISFLL